MPVADATMAEGGRRGEVGGEGGEDDKVARVGWESPGRGCALCQILRVVVLEKKKYACWHGRNLPEGIRWSDTVTPRWTLEWAMRGSSRTLKTEAVQEINLDL